VWLEREGFWVTLQDEAGRIGFGEVAPLSDWGTESLLQSAEALNRLAATRANTLEEVAPALEEAGLSRSCTPAAYAGCEGAMLDLLAQRAGVSLAAYLSRHPKASVALNALVVSASQKEAAREALALVNDGYCTLKLKVGAQALQADLARVKAVREAVGPFVHLRLDANGVWARQAALEAIQRFAAFSLQYVEQPVAAIDREGLAWVAGHCGVPIAADEALQRPCDAQALLKLPIDTLILKPMALGGLLVALEVARQAREAGKKVVLSSVLDRGVGTLACLHLAAALGNGVAPCGLATFGLFEGAPAISAKAISQGAWQLSTGPGLGLDACFREALLA
jgi:o-succinylbenzoate synthase